jgi:hypothetical protein
VAKKAKQADEQPAAPKKPAPAKVALNRDPRLFSRGVLPPPPDYKRLLGLDLGTNCGVAFIDIIPGQPLDEAFYPRAYLGQWSLDIGQYDSGTLRHVRLKQFLSVLKPDLIMFEDVKVDVPVEAFKGKPLGMLVARIVPTAEFLGGLKTTLAVWAAERDIPCHGVAITQIKKFATTKGNASKVDMILACNERFGVHLDPEGYESSGVDNIADAAHILAMAMEMYSEGL